jgi:hypothetical protein
VVVVVAFVAFFATALPASSAGSLFQPYQATAVGSAPEAVAIGDVTGDGRNDVVMTTSYNADPANDFRLWVFAQAADGTLSSPVSYATAASYPNRATSVAVGDITGDGKADVVVGVAGVGVQVFPQLASGGLGSPTTTATVNSGKIRLGHLDADARLDVAGVGWGTNTVSVLLNDGSGGLRAPVDYAAQHAGYEDLEVADVTGDARDDIVVMSGQSYAVPNISVVPQLAGGGFGSAAEYRVGTNVNTQAIGVGDVTGDGLNDVVATYGGNRPSSFVAVFAQTATGELGAPVSYPSYDIPESIDVADLNLDGRGDAVTLHGGWYAAGVYLQQADGSLAAEDLYGIPYASHYNPHGLAVGDIDGNGSPDVAIADYNNGLVVLRSTLSVPPPPPPPSADLGVAVTAGAAKVNPNKKFSFTSPVTNSGPDTSTASLVVSLTGPASALAVSDTANCTVAALKVTCTFAGLAAGSSKSVQISGTATGKGTIVAAATVTGSVSDPNAGNNQASASIQVR